MSAAVSRERRATAGKRMSSLVGKAQDDDDAFWSHETWAESDNESFRESDEDSEQRVDHFDSDFNDSESDHESEEEAAGAQAEMELLREERMEKKKQKFDIVKAGRDLMQKKKGKGKKRGMGDGINAGLVLNMPPAMTGGAPLPPPVQVAPRVPSKELEAPPSATTRSSKRSSRSDTGKRSLRAGTVNKSQEAETRRSAATTSSTAAAAAAAAPAKKKRRFTQEELLLEAATVTEPENERWLLGRKRVQESAEDAQKGLEVERRGTTICRFRSRRACLNTITFPEMDHVPDILARKHVAPAKPKALECVITGKKAWYRDPKTGMGYHDIAAFKELRRRLTAGEPLDQRVQKKKKEQDVSMLRVQGAHSSVAVPAKVTKDAQLPRVTTAAAGSKSIDAINNSVPTETRKIPATKPSISVTEMGTDMKNPAGTAKNSKPASIASNVPSAAASTTATASNRKVSPRKRKPSAKAKEAVETALLSPLNAPISNVLLHLSSSSPGTNASQAVNGQTQGSTVEETRTDQDAGKTTSSANGHSQASKTEETKHNNDSNAAVSNGPVSKAAVKKADQKRKTSMSPTTSNIIKNAMEMYSKHKQETK